MDVEDDRKHSDRDEYGKKHIDRDDDYKKHIEMKMVGIKGGRMTMTNFPGIWHFTRTPHFLEYHY